MMVELLSLQFTGKKTEAKTHATRKAFPLAPHMNPPHSGGLSLIHHSFKPAFLTILHQEAPTLSHSISGVLELEYVPESAGGLQTHIAGLHSRGSDSVGLGGA